MDDKFTNKKTNLSVINKFTSKYMYGKFSTTKPNR